MGIQKPYAFKVAFKYYPKSTTIFVSKCRNHQSRHSDEIPVPVPVAGFHQKCYSANICKKPKYRVSNQILRHLFQLLLIKIVKLFFIRVQRLIAVYFRRNQKRCVINWTKTQTNFRRTKMRYTMCNSLIYIQVFGQLKSNFFL